MIAGTKITTMLVLIADTLGGQKVQTTKENMTKQVRIENADNSNYKVVVEIWQKEFKEDGTRSDRKVDVKILPNPTAMGDFYIWKDRYLIIREEDTVIHND